MRLDSSFESLSGLAGGRSGSVADLADEAPRRPVHRHSYAAPAHNDPDIATPTKPFGLGKFLCYMFIYVFICFTKLACIVKVKVGGGRLVLRHSVVSIATNLRDLTRFVLLLEPANENN